MLPVVVRIKPGFRPPGAPKQNLGESFRAVRFIVGDGFPEKELRPRDAERQEYRTRILSSTENSFCKPSAWFTIETRRTYQTSTDVTSQSQSDMGA